LLPLLALTATGQVINRARDDGSLELLFSLPMRRSTYFAAVSLTRYTVLIAPLLLMMLAMGLLGRVVFDQEISWAYLVQVMGLCAAVVAAFVGLGIAVSTLIRSQTKAVIATLILWALGVAVLDFGLVGLMLKWHLHPETVFLLASLNPVQAARMALLSSASPELSVLGPVGFYLAQRIGASGLFALGMIWPFAVGIGAWLTANRSFARTDLV
jgi:ABC-2 type transport system permease protein